MARDCFQKGGPAGGGGFGGPPAAPKTQFDSEYQNLMAELGEGGGSAQGPVRGAITAAGEPGAGGQDGGVKIPPWRIPENWFSNCKFKLDRINAFEAHVCFVSHQLGLKVASRAAGAGADISRKVDIKATQARVPAVVLLRLVERATTTHRLELTLGDKELLVINKDMAGRTHMLRECPVALRPVRPFPDDYS